MMSRVFFRLTFCFLFPAFSEQRGTWKESGGFEYYVSSKDVSKSYDDSQKFCEDNSGQLALVKTESIHNFITTLVSSDSGAPYGFFIGLRDVYENETFKWDDGSRLGFTKWGLSEPNNIGTETCVHMGQRYEYDEHLKWNNVKCVIGTAGSAGFVCQRKIGWHWSRWTDMSTCNCSGLQKRTRDCVNTTRPGPHVCNETEIEIKNCTPHASCYTTIAKKTTVATTTATTTAPPVTTTTEANGIPPFVMPLIGGIAGFLFLSIIALVTFVIYKRRNSRKAVAADSRDKQQTGESTAESNIQAGGEYATLGNTVGETENSEYCTLNLESSTTRYKAGQCSIGNSKIVLKKKQDTEKSESQPNYVIEEAYCSLQGSNGKPRIQEQPYESLDRSDPASTPSKEILHKKDIEEANQHLPNSSDGQLYTAVKPKKDRATAKAKTGKPENKLDVTYSSLMDSSRDAEKISQPGDQMYDELDRSGGVSPPAENSASNDSVTSTDEEKKDSTQNAELYAIVRK